MNNEFIKRGLIENKDYFRWFPLENICNVDFWIPNINSVIECDGCFYHECEIHGKGYYIEIKNKDIKKNKSMTNKGIKVFRFWEHEINENIEYCVDKILSNN